jgi:carbamoyl-phosphate synthase large subunit
MNILVTGSGALLGQGIIRSINAIKDNSLIIHAADPDYRSSGNFISNKAHKIHFANHPNYIERIKEIIKNENIDVILIGTDTELPILAKYKKEIESEYSVKIIVSSTDVIDIANDKWKTAKFLKEKGFDYPKSVMANNLKEVIEFKKNVQFPYLAKPIDGARSKGLLIIENEQQLEEVIANPQNLVIQEFLNDDSGEYTSGCIVLNGLCKSVVTLKRDLRDGNTYRAYYNNEYSKFDNFVIAVAESLKVDGPCNFQFRIKNGKPVIFEINARFSGTTPLRFIFGFNEVEAVLSSIRSSKQNLTPILKEGMVIRAWSDIFISEEEIIRNIQNIEIKQPKSIFYGFKI